MGNLSTNAYQPLDTNIWHNPTTDKYSFVDRFHLHACVEYDTMDEAREAYEQYLKGDV